MRLGRPRLTPRTAVHLGLSGVGFSGVSIILFQKWKHLRDSSSSSADEVLSASKEFFDSCPIGGWRSPRRAIYWPHSQWPRIRAYAPVIEMFRLRRLKNGNYGIRGEFKPRNRDSPTPLPSWSYFWGPVVADDPDDQRYYHQAAWEHTDGTRLVFDSGTPGFGRRDGEDSSTTLEMAWRR